MRTKISAIILVLIGLIAIVGISYACNQSPVADLKAFREYVILGGSVTLDGSDSSDPDGSITKYEWDFTDNGSSYDYSETSSCYADGTFDGITTYTFDSNETYTVKLRVTDNGSATDTDTCTVNVSTDSDNDNLPDDWEDLYDLDDANSTDADEDLDSDSYNNLCEYLHDTDPNDDTSEPSDNITIYVPSDVNSIQRAINASIGGDTIVVSKGTYYEAIDFNGRACTLTSVDPNDWYVTAETIIDANDPNNWVVTFDSNENADSVLRGFTITGGDLGIYCDSASPAISNCVVRENGSGSNPGGGIYHCDSSSTVTNCFFMENDANLGGGIYDVNSSPTVTSCVFSKNTASIDGGGIYDLNSSPIVINCTFNGNSADDDGGGIYNYGASSNPILTNCIFWGNDANDANDEIHNTNSADPNFRYCDIAGCGGSGGWDPNFGTNDGGNIDSDPNFIDTNAPAGPDGMFGTYDDGLYLQLVQTISPCIDAGDGNTAPSADIAGRVRVDISDVDNTGTGDPNYTDIGAYESPTIWFVDKYATGSDDGTSWTDAFADLQDALNAANDGDEIWVAEGTYKPTSGADRSISFQLRVGVAVYGGFAGTETLRYQRNWTAYPTILSGDIGTTDDKDDNSYHVVEGAVRAALDGFIVTGGNAEGSDPDDDGAGMYINSCSVTVSNCFFSDNSASDAGGGMLIRSSSSVIVNCVFSDNEADCGGGIYIRESSGKIINCTFSANAATYGAGIRCYKGTIPTVTNCIFWGNDGEEIENSCSAPIFSYCDIEGSGGSSSWDTSFGIDNGGNIDNDPCFLNVNNPAGLDGIFGTWDDGLRLDSNSPCIDAADGYSALSADILGLAHIDINDVNNTGTGSPDYVDTGAYESYMGYDSDGDGMDDDYEILYGLNPNDDSDASEDADGDGLTNLLEFQIGTKANDTDSDDDGMDDKWEYIYGLDPLDDSDASEDADYDGRNNLLEYEDGSDPTEYTEVSRIVYEYDNSGQVTKEIIQDKVKNDVAVTQYQYDELGRRWQVRRWSDASGSDDANDIITLYSYDTRGSSKKTVRKGIGNTSTEAIQDGDLVTENFYNSLGRLTDVNDPNDGNTSYTYHTGGNVYQVTDPNGNTTSNEYDNAGRLMEITDAEGSYRENSYDSLGRVIKQIAYDSYDNALMQSRLEYNGVGQVTRSAVMADADSTSSISTSTDMVTDYNYADSNGLFTYETMYYAVGTAATTSYEYDGLGRRIKTIDPGGNQTVITYDEMGRVTRRQQIEDDPLGSNDLTITTDYVYDSLGRVHKQIEKPDVGDSGTWQTTVYLYDARGNRTQQTRPDGVVITYSYDAPGQLTEKIADYGTGTHINQKTKYGYDRLGRQSSITGYANGSTAQTTAYTYDDLDRIVKVQYPDGNDIDFVYSPAGKVIQRTDQRGIVTTYTYDGLYNMLSKSATDAGIDDAEETFTYDGISRMLTATKSVDSNTVSETEFVYNDIGRVTDTNETLFGGTTRMISYTYDQAGYPSSVTYPYSNVVINTTADWKGRIDMLELGDVNVVTYKYIGSRVAQRSYPVPSVTYQPTYDNLGRITSADSGTSYAKFDYVYEPNTSNISKQTYDHRSGDPYAEFSYDNLDRLTAAEYGIQDNNELFTIDDLGNRTNVNVRNGNDVSYSVDNLTNRYNSVGGTNLTYDAAGNLTQDKDGYQYAYDYENRIVEITENSSDIAEFAYDALGRRVRKIDSDANETTLYYYNNSWQVLCEYNGAGQFKRWYAYGNYIDEVLMMSHSYAASQLKVYVHDHLYSPAVLLRFVTGMVYERYEYDAYGNATILEPNYVPDPDQKPDWDNPYLFTGRRVDILDGGSLKIQYNRNRYYDYYTGRWLTHDPLGINPAGGIYNPFSILAQYEDGLNLYEYVKSNPVKNNDLFGLFSWPGRIPKPPKPCGILKIDLTFTVKSIKQKPLDWFKLGCVAITDNAVKKRVTKKEKHIIKKVECEQPCRCKYKKDRCYLLDFHHTDVSTVSALGEDAPPAKKDCEITVKLTVHLKTCYAVGLCCL